MYTLSQDEVPQEQSTQEQAPVKKAAIGIVNVAILVGALWGLWRYLLFPKKKPPFTHKFTRRKIKEKQLPLP